MMAAAASGPFPKFARPSAAECRRVVDALASMHGMPSRGKPNNTCELFEPHSVLDSLVRTILSQNTTDITSHRAFSSLKTAFPTWEQVRTAAPGTLEAAIRVGGLADIKAARIKAILDSLLSERGELSLEHLRSAHGPDIKQQLARYKGVGPKSIACVMMFCLGHAEFPVDTHVWEISKQLGWVPSQASREQTYQHLNEHVPDDIKYALHVLMVEHGKVCPACKKGGAAGGKRSGAAAVAAAAAGSQPCPLAEIKRSKEVDSAGKQQRKKHKSAGAAAATEVAAAHEEAAAAAVVKQEQAEVAAVAVKVEYEEVNGQHARIKQEGEVKQEPSAGQRPRRRCARTHV